MKKIKKLNGTIIPNDFNNSLMISRVYYVYPQLSYNL